MTNSNSNSAPHLEDRFRALTTKFSDLCIKAQQALSELEEVQTEIDDLKGVNSSDGLPTDLLDHLERISELNLDGMVAELLQTEQEEVGFIEDGSQPTAEPAFVDEDGPEPVISNHEQNRRDLHETARNTIATFRDPK